RLHTLALSLADCGSDVVDLEGHPGVVAGRLAHAWEDEEASLAGAVYDTAIGLLLRDRQPELLLIELARPLDVLSGNRRRRALDLQHDLPPVPQYQRTERSRVCAPSGRLRPRPHRQWRPAQLRMQYAN